MLAAIQRRGALWPPLVRLLRVSVPLHSECLCQNLQHSCPCPPGASSRRPLDSLVTLRTSAPALPLCVHAEEPPDSFLSFVERHDVQVTERMCLRAHRDDLDVHCPCVSGWRLRCLTLWSPVPSTLATTLPALEVTTLWSPGANVAAA